MKVVCIDNDYGHVYLTIGKIYTTLIDYNNVAVWLGLPDSILIKNDGDHTKFYSRDKFKTLDEIRDEKLDQIL